MRLESIRIKNNYLGWEIEEINFTSNLTLLVGASGVGKTQILRAINDLKDIVNGKSINGFEWKISFSLFSGENYTWEGAFSLIEEQIIVNMNSNILTTHIENEILEAPLLFEKLSDRITSNIIIDRNKTDIKYKDLITPKLSPKHSVINILQDDIFKNIRKAFNKIILKDYSIPMNDYIHSVSTKTQLKEKYKTIAEIKNSFENIRIKLFLCYELKLKIFNEIKSRFIDIFPKVQDIKIEQLISKEYIFPNGMTVPIISIKEKNVKKWINEKQMSSGMFRTLIHISELFLLNDGSIILIDEFENSLGINCLDILTEDLIHENKNIQFIATSHHPYIINNIPYEHWKIISRHGGKIITKDASDYKIGKSKHAAFIQLTKILDKQS